MRWPGTPRVVTVTLSQMPTEVAEEILAVNESRVTGIQHCLSRPTDSGYRSYRSSDETTTHDHHRSRFNLEN